MDECQSKPTSFLFSADHRQSTGLIPCDGEDKIIMDNVSDSDEWFREPQTNYWQVLRRLLVDRLPIGCNLTVRHFFLLLIEQAERLIR